MGKLSSCSICAETAITIARARAGRWALAALRLFRPVELLLAPVAFPLVLVSRSLKKKLPEPAPTEEQARVAELAVEHIIDEGAEAGSITKDHAAMLHSVLEFKNTIAREVMVPRTKMIAFDASTPLDQVLALGVAEGHSRYPVYRDKIDQIEGVLHVKDLSKITGARPSMEGISLASILRKPFFVAETQKIGTLLREMQQKRVHLAIVVDEFGGTAGIVTLEDILEEIVGDIQDEHDEEEQPAREIAPGRWSVDAGMSVHDLGELLGGPLVPGESEGGYDSVGGLLVDLAGQVPAVGERVEVGAYDVVVRDADEKKVRRVEIRRRQTPPETAVA
jgi:magnesium and cobalt transporter